MSIFGQSRAEICSGIQGQNLIHTMMYCATLSKTRTLLSDTGIGWMALPLSGDLRRLEGFAGVALRGYVERRSRRFGMGSPGRTSMCPI
jgi:hypothetical protein